MSFVSVLLAPFALLFGKAPAEAPPPPPQPPQARLSVPAGPSRFGFDPSSEPAWQTVAESFRVAEQNQVRIEQRIIIRVAPHRPPPPRRNLMVDVPRPEERTRFKERKMGDCVNVTNLAAVQVDRGDRLRLFLRDRRMVSARLERACHARDFYSGFYLQNNHDGRLCVDRDALQSRSGAKCKLTRIRQLIADDD